MKSLLLPIYIHHPIHNLHRTPTQHNSFITLPTLVEQYLYINITVSPSLSPASSETSSFVPPSCSDSSTNTVPHSHYQSLDPLCYQAISCAVNALKSRQHSDPCLRRRSYPYPISQPLPLSRCSRAKRGRRPWIGREREQEGQP